MRFLLGLVMGMLIGGGGVYAALKQPWTGQAAVAADAGAERAAKARGDGKRKRRKRRRRAGREGGEVPELSAADRRLVWKGDAVKRPTRNMDFGSDDPGRALSSSEINRVIRSQSEPMLSCIASARGNAPLDARITLKMLVDGQGNVVKSRMRAPAYLFAHGFYKCARRAARSMRFPATGAPTVVEAPYDLY